MAFEIAFYTTQRGEMPAVEFLNLLSAKEIDLALSE